MQKQITIVCKYIEYSLTYQQNLRKAIYARIQWKLYVINYIQSKCMLSANWNNLYAASSTSSLRRTRSAGQGHHTKLATSKGGNTSMLKKLPVKTKTFSWNSSLVRSSRCWVWNFVLLCKALLAQEITVGSARPQHSYRCNFFVSSKIQHSISHTTSQAAASACH